MQKLGLRRSLYLLLLISLGLFITNDIYRGYVSLNSGLTANKPLENDFLDGVDYLNQIRQSSNLSWFKQNKNLDLSAQNHANYLISREPNIDLSMHIESKSEPFFSGEKVSDRAIYAGYSSNYVVENISNNQINIKSSIDSLLSAIYHRFGFLNYDFDEIGYFHAKAKDKDVYVYNMGNALLNSICKNGGDFSGNGYYVDGVCKNREKIDKNIFDRAITKHSPNHIKFPNTIPALAYFGGEIPDPLPECKITANPVSVELNPNLKDIKFIDFKIYKDEEELKNSVLIDAKSDINKKFKPNQFALFVKDVFEFNQTYRAKFEYMSEGKRQNLEWEFSTKTPDFPYFVAKDGDVLKLNPDRRYDIFIKPRDCNDLFKSYSYKSSLFVKMDSEYIGLNTIRLSLSGYKGDMVELKTDDGVRIKVMLDDNSKEAFVINPKYLFLAFIFIGILILFFKRQ